jgi:hypothetical protein
MVKLTFQEVSSIFKNEEVFVLNAKVVLKNRVQIGSSVDITIWKQFQELSKTTRIPVSKLLDEAMEDLLKKYQK